MKQSRQHARRGASRPVTQKRRHWSLNWRLHTVVIALAGLSSVVFLVESEDTQASAPATQDHGLELTLPQSSEAAIQRARPLLAPSQELALPEIEVEAEATDEPQTSGVTGSGDADAGWEQVTIKPGDSLARVAYRAGVASTQIHQLMQSGHEAVNHLTRVRPGDQLRYRSDDEGRLMALEFDLNDTERLVVSQADGQFDVELVERPYEVFENRISGTIDDSLFASAKAAGLSDQLIMQLANVFGYDIDFALDIRRGDTFTVIWNEYFRNGEKVKDGEIIAAEFINNGRTVRGVRYTDADGHTDYYAPNGDSLRKEFIRSPVHFTRISSGFNPNRLHPIHKTRRPHRGVDYAARTGTPIMAAGDGKVIHKGKKGGYGNAVILKHGHTYTTLYAHMSRVHPSLRYGGRVKQGQVIGYVGATGWATGPHLHYEFRVNGVHRNPLTVKLPSAKPLKAAFLDDFDRFSQPLVAQLNTLTRTQLALNE
ncbi:MAG: peptidoglycan DD-metalloendopeptidase family protein [Pseudomonadota bacterium]